MPILFAPIGTAIHQENGDPLSHQVYDVFESYLPVNVEAHLRDLNAKQPIAGLDAQISMGELTRGQWRLYTTVCFSGQVMNGGMEGFLYNCPGLVADVRLLLIRFGSPDFSKAYEDAAEPFLDLIDGIPGEARFAEGNELKAFWEGVDAVFDQTDQKKFAPIESHAYAKDRDRDPNNWFFQVDKAVLEWITSKPEQFVQQ